MRRTAGLFLLLALLSFTAYGQMVDFQSSNQPVRMVHFSPDGRHLVAGGFMKVWDINNPSAPIFNSTQKGMEFAYAVILNSDMSKDGRYLAAVTMNKIEVYDLASKSVIKTIRGMGLSGVCFAPDNKTIAYTSTNGTLVLYDVVSQQETFNRKFRKAKPLKVAWSPDGKYIALGGRADNVILINIETKEISASSTTGGKWVMDLEFSPGATYLAVALKGGKLRLVETESGKQVAVWDAHSGGANALAFHPSGDYLASGGGDKMVKVWEVPGGTAVASWMAHDKTIAALDFSYDGSMLATGCVNQPVGSVSDTRIWDVSARTGRALAVNSMQNTEQQGDEPGEAQYSRPESTELSADVVIDQKRLALIIGNGMYENGGILANPENDANDIGARLQALGFDVMLHNNLDQRGFKVAIDEFGEKLAGYDVGLFYYAGHGIQVKGNNYLIPVDANLKSENDVEYDCVNAGRLLAKMEDAGSTTNIIILDACRDNPFERSWRRSTHGMGLAFMTAPAGSLISYATSPGATASDGGGRNGLFTTALLEYIDEPNLSLLEMFQKVRTYVRENSDGDQVPWESTSLEGNCDFKIDEIR